MFRHILVATGEQPWASRAVGSGLALAAHTGAHVCFLHVLSLPLLCWTPETTPGYAMAADSLVAHSTTVLSWVAAAAEEADVPYTVVRRWGRIPATITHLAEEVDCDLIVVGAQTCPGGPHLLQGHIARRVAIRTRRPVLVVKQPPPYAEDIVCWSRALVVLDASSGAELTREYALTLAQAEHLDVCLLYVQARRGRVRAQETCTLAAVQAAMAGVRYETQITASRSVLAILETAASRQCNVIILGTQEGPRWQRRWGGHLSRAVAAKAALPVLLVPSLSGVPAAIDS